MGKLKKNAPSAGATALGALSTGLATIGRVLGYHRNQANCKPITVTALVDGSRRIRVRGRVARTLLCLVEAGDSGISSRASFGWAHWFPSYVYDLRDRHGLEIESITENHGGIRHAHYVLRSHVKILEIKGA